MNEDLRTKLHDTFTAIITESVGLETKSYGNAGASESDIRSGDLPSDLPNEYIDFLKYANGCTLFNYKDLDGFQLFGTQELGKENKAIKKLYEEYWDESVIVFCTILGEGNYIGFRVRGGNTYEILDCFHEYVPAQWEVIGHSFDEFLERLIDLKGEKYWLKS